MHFHTWTVVEDNGGGKEQALDLVPVESLADNEERCWWLSAGTLAEQDREAMRTEMHKAASQQIEADGGVLAERESVMHSLQHKGGFGAIYNVNMLTGAHEVDEPDAQNRRRVDVIIAGYTNRMADLLFEAKRRGYAWLAFDPDVATTLKD